MDFITHGASGLIGKSFLKRYYASTCYGWLFLIGALFPDIDNIAGFWGRGAYILYHRGLTHSFFFALIFSIVVAWILNILRYGYRCKFILSWISLLFGMCVHIFMDLITSYGTQIFYPFSTHRYSLDWVFIIDPLFTIALIAFFIWAKRHAKIGILAAVFLFFYPCLCGALRAVAEQSVERIVLQEIQDKKIQVHVIPEFGTPFFWKVIIEEPEKYRLYRLSIINNHLEHTNQEYNKTDELLKRYENTSSKALETFTWFATFPFQLPVSTHNPNQKIVLGDLRFISTWDVLGSQKRMPFSLVLILDHYGRVIDAQWEKSSGH